MDKGEILKAKEQFRKCLEVDKNDSYNLVALGNMYVNSMDSRNKVSFPCLWAKDYAFHGPVACHE